MKGRIIVSHLLIPKQRRLALFGEVIDSEDLEGFEDLVKGGHLEIDDEEAEKAEAERLEAEKAEAEKAEAEKSEPEAPKELFTEPKPDNKPKK